MKQGFGRTLRAGLMEIVEKWSTLFFVNFHLPGVMIIVEKWSA